MPAQKIMVVDDSPTERFFIADLLAKRGYVVVTAESGVEALAKIRVERPSLVVMDVVMPGASGFQVVRTLTRDPETQSIPVILCTSKSAETDRIWGPRRGAGDYGPKPVDAEAIRREVPALAHGAPPPTAPP